MGELEIRCAEPGDAASLRAAHAAAFAADGGPARTAAEWDWLDANPAGPRTFVAVDDGRVVAQYAARAVHTLVAGEPRTFSQIVDSFVVPEYRRGALFVRTARAFFDAFGGPERDAVCFGWPNERAWRIGRRALGYGLVRTQDVLVREVDPGEAPVAGDARVERLGRLEGEELVWLFERLAAHFGAATIRDAAYLGWRYDARPGARYSRLAARDDDGVLRGLAVTAPGRGELAGLELVCELLVPPGEPDVLARLVRGVVGGAAARGARAVLAVSPEWWPPALDLQELGFRVRPSGYRTVARAFDGRLRPDWLREHWWYQLGDTDLV